VSDAAKDYKRAMDDLHAGRISAETFRAFVRRSKAQHGLAQHELAKVFYFDGDRERRLSRKTFDAMFRRVV
jgi:hypothetical protein